MSSTHIYSCLIDPGHTYGYFLDLVVIQKGKLLSQRLVRFFNILLYQFSITLLSIGSSWIVGSIRFACFLEQERVPEFENGSQKEKQEITAPVHIVVCRYFQSLSNHS